jgi:hypothetical protein
MRVVISTHKEEKRAKISVLCSAQDSFRGDHYGEAKPMRYQGHTGHTNNKDTGTSQMGGRNSTGAAIKKPDSCSNPLLKKNQTIKMLSPSM